MATLMSEHRESVKASDLKPGHLVDLESCPYLRTHPSAEFELALVVSVERETDDCVRVDYEGIDSVGYAPDVVLSIGGEIDPETGALVWPRLDLETEE